MGDGASLVWTGGDSLYALRGEFNETFPLYDFWSYSLASGNWTIMTDIPAYPHSGGGGGVGDGGSLLYIGFWVRNQTDYIYATSGNQAHPDSIPDNRTYRYTISNDSWTQLADLPFGIGYYVGCRLGYAEEHIYAWQGTPSSWEHGGDDLASYKVLTRRIYDVVEPYGKVDMKDIGFVARHFGTNQGDPDWNPRFDINGPTGEPDGTVDMRDIGLVALHFGEEY
jgi:hypothetical protein